MPPVRPGSPDRLKCHWSKTMNRAELEEIEPEECPSVEGESRVLESCGDYLTDESGMDPQPVSAIYFPDNTAQVVNAVRGIRRREERIVVSASRTGVAGGAVAVANASIISLERMTATLGERRYQAGIRLEKIPRTAREYYPVDPTEKTASLGGTASTNASGARTFFYGPTRGFIEELTVVLCDGMVLRARRGEVLAEGEGFVLGRGDGEIAVPVSEVRLPPTKNASGLYLARGMDLVDLFVGSEGTLGIITEVGIRMARLPEKRLFLVAYAGSEDEALDLVEAVKADLRARCLAIEYMDPNALDLLRSREAFRALPPDVACALYLEMIDAEDARETLERLLSSGGCDPDRTWAGFTDEDLEAMKELRHAVPATVNAVIAERKREIPGLHKVGTDTAVPEGRLKEFLSRARAMIESEGLEYVVFGHAGDNHMHINMLPRSSEELKTAEALYSGIARESVRLGGTVSAEHGIGRLKKDLLPIGFSDAELHAMRRVKDALDPRGTLNPGVIF